MSHFIKTSKQTRFQTNKKVYKQIMFITLKSIVLGLIALSSLTYSQSPLSCEDQCSYVKYNVCQICYRTCQYPVDPTAPPGTANFTLRFQSCQYLYCARQGRRIIGYEITDSTTSVYYQTYCVLYAWQEINQTQCTQSCCNKPSYSQFNNQTFMQCAASYQDLSATTNNVPLIIGLTIGGFFFVLILICIFIKCKDRIKNCCCLPTLPQTERTERRNENLQTNDRIVVVPPVSSRVWVQIQSKMKPSASEICSICLDGNVNCETSCGHKFHLLCFHTWIRKRAECPLCKNNNFNEMRLFCEKCKNRESRQNLTSNKILVFINEKTIKCDTCQDWHLVIKQKSEQNQGQEHHKQVWQIDNLTISFIIILLCFKKSTPTLIMIFIAQKTYNIFTS